MVALAAVGIYADLASKFSTAKKLCDFSGIWDVYPCTEVKASAALNIIDLLLCAVSVVISGAAIYFVHKTPQAASVDA